MSHPSLEKFTSDMDRLVGAETDSHAIAKATSFHLAELLLAPEFLEDRFRQPSSTGYTQHVVHVNPEGRYSIVALVWLPGQATPIHDHRCWCVVGVLEGSEHQTRYHLFEDDDTRFLRTFASERFSPGEVCALVPPEEDIHLVKNEGEVTGISIHIYGDDISQVGTSINRTFDLPVDESASASAKRVSWRDFESETPPRSQPSIQ